jgi:hypothetical protein
MRITSHASLPKRRFGDRGTGADVAHGFAALIARWHGSVGVVIDRSTESQRFDCLLKRAMHCRGLERATIVAIPIPKRARRVTVLRKTIR